MNLPDHAAMNEAQTSRRNSIVKHFLLRNEPVFVRLEELKAKGWRSPEVTTHFKRMRQQADTIDPEGRKLMYEMMQQIGEEMDLVTNALSLPDRSDNEAQILDLCMAPGGFSAAALEKNFGAKVRGVSLPVACGGYEIFLVESFWGRGRIQCQFLDITMLATEFGVSSIPDSHPERSRFLTDRPYLGESFQLVFCGGNVTHNPDLPKHREKLEIIRPRTSQLILALQRISIDGTLVVLLHRANAWDTVQLLYDFSQFSNIQLFKPRTKHGVRSSFWLVAKHVQPGHQAAKTALSAWKKAWSQATFGGPETEHAVADENDAVVQQVLDEFGTKLIELARPIWEIQSNALISTGIV